MSPENLRDYDKKRECLKPQAILTRALQPQREGSLNKTPRDKKRIPNQARQPLSVPDKANQVRADDFMGEALKWGGRFKTFEITELRNFRALPRIFSMQRLFFAPLTCQLINQKMSDIMF